MREREESVDEDRLNFEIFSILESKFLFGYEEKKLLRRPAAGRVRVLSLDAGGATAGLFAAACLTHLEAALQRLTADPAARIADFFDVAAGAGAGGVLAALLFAGGADGRPLFSAAAAFRLLAAFRRRRRRRLLRRLLGKNPACNAWDKAAFEGVFGRLTLRHALKPLLVACYDAATAAPFLFSRAAAADSESFDFLLRDVCAATVGGAAEVRSVDGATVVAALDGGVAAGNPAAAAITHVLNNRGEFPFSVKPEDLFVLSVGNGEAKSPSLPSEIARVAAQVAVDMVDQAVSMAFGEWRPLSYVRIQASVASTASKSDSEEGAMAAAAALLGQKSVEAVLFQGRQLSDKTNEEKLEETAAELIREREGRKSCPFPVVIFKPTLPRSSSFSLSASPKLKPGSRQSPVSSPPTLGETL
ncbi:patatin-like protein 3 [Wolffia australiana]